MLSEKTISGYLRFRPQVQQSERTGGRNVPEMVGASPRPSVPVRDRDRKRDCRAGRGRALSSPHIWRDSLFVETLPATSLSGCNGYLLSHAAFPGSSGETLQATSLRARGIHRVQRCGVMTGEPRPYRRGFSKMWGDDGHECPPLHSRREPHARRRLPSAHGSSRNARRPNELKSLLRRSLVSSRDH